MQLEASLDEFTANGLGVVTISYDTVEILKSFADRMGGFRYSTLADPDSEIIEAYGIRNPNPEPGSRTDGMAFPGTYIVDADGIVQQKFFHDSHRIRETAETILMKTFGADGGRRIEAQLPQFDFVAYASQDSLRPGNTVTLVTEIELPDRMHLYAPGSDYTAADLEGFEAEERSEACDTLKRPCPSSTTPTHARSRKTTTCVPSRRASCRFRRSISSALSAIGRFVSPKRQTTTSRIREADTASMSRSIAAVLVVTKQRP